MKFVIYNNIADEFLITYPEIDWSKNKNNIKKSAKFDSSQMCNETIKILKLLYQYTDFKIFKIRNSSCKIVLSINENKINNFFEALEGTKTNPKYLLIEEEINIEI